MAKNAEDQSPDAFISELAAEIKKTRAKLLVIDSLTSFEHQFKDDMYFITKRLASLAREYEITTIFTVLTTQYSELILSDLGISSIFQNIILLRYVELEGRMTRTMIILKMRSTRHDQSIMEFDILAGEIGSDSSRGIRIGGTLEGYIGVMTGGAQKAPRKFAAREIKISRRQQAAKKERRAKFEAMEKEIEEREADMQWRRVADMDKKIEEKGRGKKKQGRKTGVSRNRSQ